jgi:hypothetical protein
MQVVHHPDDGVCVMSMKNGTRPNPDDVLLNPTLMLRLVLST